MRMSQTHPLNDSKVRSLPKEVLGHPPRNPAQAPTRQAGYPTPHLESKTKGRTEPQNNKSNKNKGRGRTSPVDSNFGAMPHGLTVQELKELTRIRLAREAVPYSPEASEYSDARTHTTNATFRSGYTAGDVDSYSDSGSAHRNRSTSTSPISNTDSDSFEEGYTRYTSYHPSLPISPSSLTRSDRERQIPYSPDQMMPPFIPSPHTSPIHVPSQPLPQFPPTNGFQKICPGIHPGLQKTPREIPLDPRMINPENFIEREVPRETQTATTMDSNIPVFTSANRVAPAPNSLGERDPLPSSHGSNSLRKFVQFII